MPKLSTAVPKYRKHRASKQAVVTINGRDHYLGPHGTKASRLKYDRLVNLRKGRPVREETKLGNMGSSRRVPRDSQIKCGGNGCGIFPAAEAWWTSSAAS